MAICCHNLIAIYRKRAHLITKYLTKMTAQCKVIGYFPSMVKQREKRLMKLLGRFQEIGVALLHLILHIILKVAIFISFSHKMQLGQRMILTC